MPVRQKTLDPKALRDQVHELFFPEGKEDSRSVGFELELWPFRHNGDNPIELVRFFDEKGTGLIEILKELQGSIQGLTYRPTADSHKFLIGDGGNLTFEPGGQLEYSGPPKPSLAEGIADIAGIIEELRCAFKPYNIWFFHSGLNPWYTVDEVGLLLTKGRYVHMNNLFKAVGHYGQKMMRLSTSLQVNLDTGDPATIQRRWLAANLLGPVFTALFGNSPFVHRKATGAYSYRSLIWQRLEPSRTGFPKGMLAETYEPCPVEQYTDFALDAHNMRLPDPSGELTFDGTFKSFRDWMHEGHNGYFPTLEDWKRHLSTLFPEVRARGFLEVRFLDAQSKVWCAVPGILLTSLLYHNEATETVIEMLKPYRTTLPGMLETAAYKGMDEPEIARLAGNIYKLAMDVAAREQDAKVAELCERFFATYTYNKRNPGAELVRLNDGNLFTPEQYRDFEKAQVQSAGDILSIICEYN
ncbi:MAG: glutamate-cysteine ligase family protein [Acidobacteriota bacterium]|nr:glutamate-cysteine ligase family protein [Acidobacteriota bacterium]